MVAAVAMLGMQPKLAVDMVAGAAAKAVPVRQQRQVRKAMEGAAEGATAELVTQQEPPLEREAAAELPVTLAMQKRPVEGTMEAGAVALIVM